MDFIDQIAKHRDWILPAITAVVSGLGGLYFRFRRKPVCSHQVFTYLYEYMHNYLPNWRGPGSQKAILLKRCVKMFSAKYLEWLKKCSVDNTDWTGENLMESYRAMLDSFELEMRNDAVPSIFISKWKQFTQATADHMFHYLKQCAVYPDEYSRKFYLLTMAQLLFFSSLHDLNNVCTALNGELERELSGK